MDAGLSQLLIGIGSFIAGGGVLKLITLGTSKKKADVEVKVDEIKALHDTIELVYEPLVKQLKERVAEQDQELASLRKQLAEEREARQKEMKAMNDRILAITSAIGINTRDYIRDNRGRFRKSEEDS